jgi:hypothetical protein
MINSDEVLHSARVRIGEEAVSELPRQAGSGSMTLISRRLELNVDFDRKEYQLGEFALYQDIELIEVLYRCLFKRSPDVSGTASTLADLRNGKCNFLDITMRLLDSDEGRLHGVVVHGIDQALRRRKLYELPHIGSMLRRMAAALTVLDLRKQISQMARSIMEQRLILRETQDVLADVQAELAQCRREVAKLQLQRRTRGMANAALQGNPDA